MARGGKRQGQPGQAYGNRTDLNPPKPAATAFTGQPYGQGVQQAQAQQALPVGGTPVPPPQPGGAGPMPQSTPVGQMPQPTGPAPGSAGDFTRPTERPGEPVTHGLPTGPGGGPEVLGPTAQAPMDPVTARIYALYKRFPLQEIADLLS